MVEANDNTKKVYPIVVDWKHYLFFLGFIELVFGSEALLGYFIGVAPIIYMSAAYAILILLLALIAPQVRYELTKTEICIRQPLIFPQRILLGSIVEVLPVQLATINGCTPRGLRINYLRPNRKTSFAIVAPRNQEDFLRELERAAPHLMRVEDRLVKICVPKYIG